MQILSIMDDSQITGVVLLSIVPYAVSLSLSVACRDLRQSTTFTKRIRAQKMIEKGCHHLTILGKTFWSAILMGQTGRKILRDADELSAGQSLETITDTNACESRPLRHSTMAPDYGTPGFDFANPAYWSLDIMEGFLESNLDPSIPTLLQDMEYAPLSR
jgi:hypothetical protein